MAYVSIIYGLIFIAIALIIVYIIIKEFFPDKHHRSDHEYEIKNYAKENGGYHLIVYDTTLFFHRRFTRTIHILGELEIDYLIPSGMYLNKSVPHAHAWNPTSLDGYKRLAETDDDDNQGSKKLKIITYN